MITINVQRSVRVCIVATVLAFAARAQDTVKLPGAIHFTYTILQTEEAGASSIAARGDTVLLRLYYVDVACSEYEYFFRQDGNTLTIRRLTIPPATCNKEEDMLYAFEGMLTGVRPGKYLIELRSMINGRDELLWRDVIITGAQRSAGRGMSSR